MRVAGSHPGEDGRVVSVQLPRQGVASVDHRREKALDLQENAREAGSPCQGRVGTELPAALSAACWAGRMPAGMPAGQNVRTG